MVNGFSSADPSLAKGPQVSAGEYTRRFGGGGGGGSPAPAPQSSVSIQGNTVFINGQGFSVMPSEQARFIQQRTSGYGSSAQQAIKQAQQTQVQELKRQQEEAKRLADQIQKEKQQKAFGQTISGQVKKGVVPSFGTIQNYGMQKTPSTTSQIYTQPTIEKRTTGSFRDVDTGRNIPTTSYFLLEPPGKGGGKVKETEIKPSAITPSGVVFKVEGYEDVTVAKEAEISSEKRTLTKKATTAIGGVYEQAESRLRKTFTDPIASTIVEATKGTSFGGETGLTLEKAKSNIRESTEYLISGKYPKVLARGGEFISGVGIGITEDVRTKPGKQVAILAATAGIGYGLSAATVGATSAATKILGTTAGLYTGTALKVGQVGAGVVLGGGFAIKTGGEVISKAKEGDYLGAGSTLGVASKDIGIGVYGFKGGQKLFSQTRGWWATRGRTELNIQQGDYPTAPASKQLEMFKKNIYPELGAKPGAFHTTSDIFYKGGKITPQAGTSELPGLYGSTQISKPFARISGSGDKAKLFSGFKNLFKVEGRPGVAYLQPESFRYSQAVRQPNIIGGQKFSYRFVSPPKPGVADVPLIKSEIEAIFRTGAGEYGFTSGSYYTKIKGVSVPIDVFKYTGPTGSTPVISLKVPTFSGLSAKGYYSGVPSSPILTPSTGIVSSIISSVRSSMIIPSSSVSLVSSYKPAYSSLGYGQSSVLSYVRPSGVSSYIYSGSSKAFGSSSPGASSSLSYAPYGGSSLGGSSSGILLPGRPGGLLPKFPKIHEKPKAKRQLYKQPTEFQTSFTGSILNLKIDKPGFQAGALSLRGLIEKKSKKKKKNKRL